MRSLDMRTNDYKPQVVLHRDRPSALPDSGEDFTGPIAPASLPVPNLLIVDDDPLVRQQLELFAQDAASRIDLLDRHQRSLVGGDAKRGLLARERGKFADFDR